MNLSLAVFFVVMAAYASLFLTIGYHAWCRLSRGDLATPMPLP